MIVVDKSSRKIRPDILAGQFLNAWLDEIKE